VSDKDAQRNVRSTTKEGFQTPTQKHFHSLSEKGNVYFGKHQSIENIQKNNLLEKFKERELEFKKEPEKGKEPASKEEI